MPAPRHEPDSPLARSSGRAHALCMNHIRISAALRRIPGAEPLAAQRAQSGGTRSRLRRLGAVVVACAVVSCSASCSSSANKAAGPKAPGGGRTSSGHVGGGSKSPARTVSDVCGLLTDAQVATATKTTVQAHRPESSIAGAACRWDLASTNPSDLANPYVTVAVESNDDLGAGIDTFADATRGYSAVPGLGEKAATGVPGGVGGPQLVVLAHGLVLTVVSQVHEYDTDNKTANQSLAELVLPKL